jgi:hypothetical protein
MGLMTLRITDRLNGANETSPGTAEDYSFTWGVQCANGACNSVTSADSTIPGIAKEQKRAVWQLGELRILDGGNDGDLGVAGSPGIGTCPPACEGNDDETLFLTQGLFAP